MSASSILIHISGLNYLASINSRATGGAMEVLRPAMTVVNWFQGLGGTQGLLPDLTITHIEPLTGKIVSKVTPYDWMYHAAAVR